MTAGNARIAQLAISNGGVPKTPVLLATVTELGIVGDRQKHTKFHGGVLRALCLYSLELIEKLQAEGHPIYPGSTGENVTISGVDWTTLASGTRMKLGDEVEIQLTKEADPCRTIAASFANGTFRRLEEPGEMRWYCRIVTTGTVRVGDAVHVLAATR
jgi:MOSC domain-containing protein YiiM